MEKPEPFTKTICDQSDNLGIALYQRLNFKEAALFLRFSAKKLRELQEKREIAYIQLTDDQVEFFGYQLIEYLADSITPRTPPPQTEVSQNK